MSVRWDEALFSTGIDSVDADHKELFSVANELLEATRQGNADLAVAALSFLQEYVTRHFTMEESLMTRLRCPMEERNQEEHRHFERQLELLAADLERRGPDGRFASSVQKLVCDWLVNHIMTVDRSLRAHVGA